MYLARNYVLQSHIFVNGRLLIIKQVKCYFFISAARCYKNTLSFLSIIFVFFLKKTNKQNKTKKHYVKTPVRGLSRAVTGCVAP